MKTKKRSAEIALLLALSFGLLVPSWCPIGFAADDATTSASAASDAAAPVAVDEFFKKAESLITDFYPRAKIVSGKNSLHFEFKVKSEVSHYTHKAELVPQFGGIAGDLTLKPGEYTGPDKDRLPSEQIDGFHTVLTVAPFSKKANSHMLLKLNFPADASADFKDRFKELMKEFNADETGSSSVAAKTESAAPTATTTTPTTTPSSTSSTPSTPTQAADAQAPSSDQSNEKDKEEKKLILLSVVNGICPEWDGFINNEVLKILSGESDDEIKKYSQSPQLTPAQRIQYKQAFLQVCAKKRARFKELMKEEGVDLTDVVVEHFVEFLDLLGFNMEDFRDFSELGKLIENAKLNFPRSAEKDAWNTWRDKLNNDGKSISEAMDPYYRAPYQPLFIEIGAISLAESTKKPVVIPNLKGTPEEIAEKKAQVDKLMSAFSEDWVTQWANQVIDSRRTFAESEIDDNKKLTSSQKLQNKKDLAKKFTDKAPAWIKEHNAELKENALVNVIALCDKLTAWTIDDYRRCDKLVRLVKHGREIIPAPDGKDSKAFIVAITEKGSKAMLHLIERFKPMLIQVNEEERNGNFRVSLPKAAPAKKAPPKKAAGKKGK